MPVHSDEPRCWTAVGSGRCSGLVAAVKAAASGRKWRNKEIKHESVGVGKTPAAETHWVGVCGGDPRGRVPVDAERC